MIPEINREVLYGVGSDCQARGVRTGSLGEWTVESRQAPRSSPGRGEARADSGWETQRLG